MTNSKLKNCRDLICPHCGLNLSSCHYIVKSTGCTMAEFDPIVFLAANLLN